MPSRKRKQPTSDKDVNAAKTVRSRYTPHVLCPRLRQGLPLWQGRHKKRKDSPVQAKGNAPADSAETLSDNVTADARGGVTGAGGRGNRGRKRKGGARLKKRPTAAVFEVGTVVGAKWDGGRDDKLPSFFRAVVVAHDSSRDRYHLIYYDKSWDDKVPASDVRQPTADDPWAD